MKNHVVKIQAGNENPLREKETGFSVKLVEPTYACARMLNECNECFFFFLQPWCKRTVYTPD